MMLLDELDPKIADALRALGLVPGNLVTAAMVKSAYKEKAKAAHPDAGGSDEQMKALNEAKIIALEWVDGLENPKCVCRGFFKNPLCPEHGRPSSPPSESADEEPCSECGGTKKVARGTGFTKIMMICPKCS